ncbi:MAG: hypothetical protein JWM64_568 [Frankiales bacterium]|nr:hypothetical protein [Frankiales bacterium]
MARTCCRVQSSQSQVVPRTVTSDDHVAGGSPAVRPQDVQATSATAQSSSSRSAVRSAASPVSPRVCAAPVSTSSSTAAPTTPSP